MPFLVSSDSRHSLGMCCIAVTRECFRIRDASISLTETTVVSWSLLCLLLVVLVGTRSRFELKLLRSFPRSGVGREPLVMKDGRVGSTIFTSGTGYMLNSCTVPRFASTSESHEFSSVSEYESPIDVFSDVSDDTADSESVSSMFPVSMRQIGSSTSPSSLIIEYSYCTGVLPDMTKRAPG